MRIVYNAESIIDAHLVKHALEDAGIACYVSGEYLSGGIGELPIGGIVAVAVDDDSWTQARAVVDEVAKKLSENAFALDEDEDVDATVVEAPSP